MTFSANTSQTASSSAQASNRTIGTLAVRLRGFIGEYLETRKANKSRPVFRNPKDIQLERAQHDVNRLWRGQI